MEKSKKGVVKKSNSKERTTTRSKSKKRTLSDVVKIHSTFHYVKARKANDDEENLYFSRQPSRKKPTIVASAGAFKDIIRLGTFIKGDVKNKHVKLYFNISEFTSKEIAGIISGLSDIYRSVGGDGLEIKGSRILDFKKSFEPAEA